MIKPVKHTSQCNSTMAFTFADPSILVLQTDATRQNYKVNETSLEYFLNKYNSSFCTFTVNLTLICA